MRTFLIRLWFLITVSVAAALTGSALTVLTQQSLWIAIAGSVMTLLGGVAACRKFFRLGMSETWVSNIPVGGGGILPTEDDYELAQQEDKDDRAGLLAFFLVVIGTPMQIVGYLLS